LSGTDKQTKLTDFFGEGQRTFSSSPRPLHVVRPGEDKLVAIGKHTVPLSLLAELFRLFFAGLSARDLDDHFATKGLSVSHVTLWEWILAISHLVYAYSSRLGPAVGNKWYCDEMRVGRYWLVFVYDRATHFILAGAAILSRSIARLRRVLETARVVAGKCPTKLRTDGCSAYREACRKEFGPGVHDWKAKNEAGGFAWINFQEGSQRPTRARIDAMVCFHGTPEEAQDLVEGYVSYHNYVDRSPSEGNRTPAEASAMPCLGDDPAATLIWSALGEDSCIPLRHHAPRRRRRILLTRWVPACYTMLRFLIRQHLARSRKKRVYLDKPILTWC